MSKSQLRNIDRAALVIVLTLAPALVAVLGDAMSLRVVPRVLPPHHVWRHRKITFVLENYHLLDPSRPTRSYEMTQ